MSITAAKATVIPANEGRVPTEGYKRWRREKFMWAEEVRKGGGNWVALTYTHHHM